MHRWYCLAHCEYLFSGAHRVYTHLYRASRWSMAKKTVGKGYMYFHITCTIPQCTSINTMRLTCFCRNRAGIVLEQSDGSSEGYSRTRIRNKVAEVMYYQSTQMRRAKWSVCHPWTPLLNACLRHPTAVIKLCIYLPDDVYIYVYWHAKTIPIIEGNRIARITQ